MKSYGLQILEEMGWSNSEYFKRKKIREDLKEKDFDHHETELIARAVNDYLKKELNKDSIDEDELMENMLGMVNKNGELNDMDEDEMKELLIRIVSYYQ